ncbi:uncharacterized protein LOC128546815 [Mercenaria mercenaria]|uniref:uncharacterized protein LOC128546815 n=1 Tax=Mercenaria mercenaria TaxID=6596 RepID=UPI00234E3E57|nr:uncharacterized protein LOC128546815 [Mercenaria mercenaria]
MPKSETKKQQSIYCRQEYSHDTIVFNPAIPVESLKMIRPNNVDSITVTYISPRNSRPKPVVEDEKPQKLVRFPQQPYAVEVVIKVTRDDRNEPMSFQVSIWACYEVVTETTPSVPTASSPSTTSVVSTSSVYTSAPSSSSSYTGSTSSSSPYTSTTVFSSVHMVLQAAHLLTLLQCL